VLRKLTVELLIVAGSILLIWGVFKWINLNKEIKNPLEVTVEQEKTIGKFLINNYKKVMPLVEKKKVKQAVNNIKMRLTETLEFSEYKYEILVVNNPNINAFAFPGGYILLFSGLMDFAKNGEEVAAVLAHEIGHMEKRHILKKLIKAVGLQTIKIIMSGGDTVVLTEVGQTLVSTLFDRQHEKEADKFALDLLAVSNIDPRIMATFFRRLQKKYESGAQDLAEKLEIINTHPNVQSRIQEALSYNLPPSFKEKKISVNWANVKNALK
jgi:predicted Zn-dependent protease